MHASLNNTSLMGSIIKDLKPKSVNIFERKQPQMTKQIQLCNGKNDQSIYQTPTHFCACPKQGTYTESFHLYL